MREVVDAILPAVVDSLAPVVPEERVYVNERDSSDLPMCWLYVANEAPGGTPVEVDLLLHRHLWASTYGDLYDLEERLSWLSGHTEGGIRYGRPSVTRNREEDAWHSTALYPVFAFEPGGEPAPAGSGGGP